MPYDPEPINDVMLDIRADRLAPPHNSEAEQGLLGTLLLDNRQFENVSDILKPEHFYHPANGRIFDVIGQMINRGGSASPVTLKNHFLHDGDLDNVGGAGYLVDLVGSVVTTLACRDYARTIIDLHRRRGLIAIASEMTQKAKLVDIDMPVSMLIEEAEQDLYKLSDSGDGTGGPKYFSEVLAKVVDSAGAAYRGDPVALGISTFLTDLDRKLGGLRPGKFYLLAARPSQGKTSLATNIAFRAAQAAVSSKPERGGVVAFFSLEMQADELGHRIMCQRAGLDSDRVSKGTLSQEEFRRFVTSSQELAALPLHIDDTPGLSVAQVRTRSRRLKRKHGLGLVVVDYLQLLRGSGSKHAKDNRAAEVAEISRDLKELAKELGVPVLALSQLSRTIEQRDDKRPQLADLRESGSLEQDSDVVMFIYREEYYLEREEPKRTAKESHEAYTNRTTAWLEMKLKAAGIGEIILGKNRGGPIGVVRTHWDGPTTTFSDLHENYRLEQ